MRNLVVLQEAALKLPDCASESIVKCTVSDYGQGLIFLLTDKGHLFAYDFNESSSVLTLPANNSTTTTQWILNNALDDNEQQSFNDWFYVSLISETGNIVCISHSGAIVSIQENVTRGGYGTEMVLQGMVDGGIAAAQWSPDQSILVLVTNNHSLLAMTNTWDVVQEVPIVERSLNTACSLSWRNDGQYFALVSVDAEDSTARVRIYNKELEIHATGRNVAEGAAATLQGIGSSVAFGSGGALIAVFQQRVKGKHQIAFLEKNGLRHGDFDVKIPSNFPTECQPHDWQVVSLHWDPQSSVLAVGLRLSNDASNLGPNSNQKQNSLVQLYYRNNYHWYLKQQWSGCNLTCLGFDAEILGRLYVSTNNSFGGSNQTNIPAIHTVQLTWDVAFSDTMDGTVAVIDGSEILLTPFGHAIVPPPMSKNKLSLPSACKSLSFWKSDSSVDDDVIKVKEGGDLPPVLWGMACLCDGLVARLCFGNEKGNVDRHLDIDISKVLAKFGPECLSQFHIRSLTVTPIELHTLALFLLGYRISVSDSNTHENRNSDDDLHGSGDEYLIIHIESQTGKVLKAKHNFFHSGSVTRVVPIPGDNSHVALGITSIDKSHNGKDTGVSDASWGSFDIAKVCVDLHDIQPQDSVEDEDGVLYSVGNDQGHWTCLDSSTGSLPYCTHFSLVSGVDPNQANDNSDSKTESKKVISISLGNGRMYCNDVPLMAGVSSFVVNTHQGMLLYTSIGTSPHLHFMTISSLLSLDSMHGVDQHIVEAAEPRPIERGGLLVASVPGDARVIIQLPRGNLETFEPRPLILMQVRNLLDKELFYQCLKLLRRQRIDMNIIVDYNPYLFLNKTTRMVKDIINAKNTELLSLLVSALEPTDVTMFKYPALRSTVPNTPNSDFGATKVNTVCEAIRSALLPILLESGNNSALNPILCTFAKQSPPLLTEAFSLIRQLATPKPAQVSGGDQKPLQMSMASLHGPIKYLLFLKDGQLLFDSAMGMCDFDMARATAQQCQMDPKFYLPLLESFEKIGKGYPPESHQSATMFYAVNKYLNRHEAAIEWGVKALRCYAESVQDQATMESNVNDAVYDETMKEVASNLFLIIKGNNLYEMALPLLSKLVIDIGRRMKQVSHKKEESSTSTTPSNSKRLPLVSEICSNLLNTTRKAHGDWCVSKMNHREAVAAYLSTNPPCAAEAIRSARLEGNWQQALMISGRFSSTLSAEYTPQRIAQDIVAGFREVLEQGEVSESDLFDDSANNNTDDSTQEGTPYGDKNIEAAQLCLDYCDDTEGAVEILILSRRWYEAANAALKKRRTDLLHQEIYPAAKQAAEEVIETLPARGKRQQELVAELLVLWENPTQRLEQVASTEASLMKALMGDGGAEHEDNKSDFSATSGASNLSMLSTRSGSTHSVVSVLSNLSVRSAAESERLSREKANSGSHFSVEGLEHSLLSRGKGNDYSKGKDNASSRRMNKRADKKRTKGVGRDVWGLVKECSLCNELWKLANVAGVARVVIDLCQVILLVGGLDDLVLVCKLQAAMDSYALQVQKFLPPIAPRYPAEWLEERLMGSVRRFQDIQTTSQSSYTNSQQGAEASGATSSGNAAPVKTWWTVAADGIKKWQKTRTTLALR